MGAPTRVFLVEDEADFAALVRHSARRRRDWALVGEACSLAEAMEGIEGLRPDVVLLDLGLPDSDGLATVETMLARFEPIGIVVLTANASESLASDALSAGAQDYLDKAEATPSVLSRTVRYAADRARYAAAMVRQQEAMEAFSTHAAHDLRSPLRAIRSFAELLAEDLEPQLGEEHKMYLRELSAGAARMQNLVEDLMAYARSGHDDAFQRVPLSSLVAELEQEFAAGGTRGRTTFDIAALPDIMGQRTAVQQALRNLIDNAVKFRSEDDLVVRMRGTQDGGRVYLEVSDNGIGIPADDLQTVVQPFARVHGPREYAGSGLGLALVQRVVERHGGRVALTSELGRGTCVTIDFAAATPP
ncbi:MAG: sensor histidine kinase [Nannocystaceae bacterium]|nr:ATP-binding protein [bacterium]